MRVESDVLKLHKLCTHQGMRGIGHTIVRLNQPCQAVQYHRPNTAVTFHSISVYGPGECYLGRVQTEICFVR